MKKTFLIALFLIALFGASLTLAGCAELAPTKNQDTDQPTVDQQAAVLNRSINTNTNQPQNENDYLNYTGNKFELSYPSYLKIRTETSGVRTTVSFSGTKSANEVESLISVSTMPNQGGVTLSEYSQEIIKQSPYIKSKELTVSGVLAYELIISESGAGSRYLFLSRDSYTIYDLIIQNFDNNDQTTILTNFNIKQDQVKQLSQTQFNQMDNTSKPSSLPTICEDKLEGIPVITSLSTYSGFVGTKLEIEGCNFAGFEGDKNAWIENGQGIKGLLHGNAKSTAKLLKVTLESPLCQKDTSYSGLPCDAWLTLTTGTYEIYTAPWGKESNKVKFTIHER